MVKILLYFMKIKAFSFRQPRSHAAVNLDSEPLNKSRVYGNFPCWDFLGLLICY